MHDDALIELRRDIHRWPELAGAEVLDSYRSSSLTIVADWPDHPTT